MRLSLGFGLSNFRPASGPVVELLRSLSLSNTSVLESIAQGATVGAIQNTRDGSTLSITDTAGNRFALSGGNIVRGATALDYETATSHQITLRETNATYPNSPRDTVITISVTNVFEQPDLGALALSVSELTQGQAATVNITGATAGSTISGAVPDGLTLNSGARTITGTPTTVGSFSFTLTETLADSANSPRSSTVSLAVIEAPVEATPLAFATAGDHTNVNPSLSSITGADTTTPDVTLRINGVAAENISASPVWWNAFAEFNGALDRQPTFRLATTGYRFGTFKDTQRFLWSYDARSWQAFDNDNLSTTSRVCSNNTPFTQNRVYFSTLPIIKATDRGFYLGEIAASAPTHFRSLPGNTNGIAGAIPGGRIGASGQTIPSLPVYGAQIEDFSSTFPKRTMVLVMGTHPSEDHAERQGLAFLREFVSNPYLLSRWRVLAYMINPAGGYGGSHRTTFEGTEPGGNAALADNDSNRQWTSNPAPLADVEAFKVRVLADIAALGLTRVDAYFDLHGAAATTRVFTYVGPTVRPAEQAFGDLWKQLDSDFFFEIDASTASAHYAWAKQAVSPEFSYSGEVGGGWGALDESGYDIFGEQMAQVLETATMRGVFPQSQTSGIMNASTSSGAGILARPSPNTVSASRNAWSAN